RGPVIKQGLRQDPGLRLSHDMYELVGEGRGRPGGSMMQNLNSRLSDSQRVKKIRRGRSRMAGPRRRLDPELLHLAVQVGALDAQLARGLAEVPTGGGGP